MFCTGAAGCVWWGKRGKGSGQGRSRDQAVSKSASGVPFNQDLDSARGPGPEDPSNPTAEDVMQPSPVGPQPDAEPDHAPPGDSNSLPTLHLTQPAYLILRLDELIVSGVFTDALTDFKSIAVCWPAVHCDPLKTCSEHIA